MTRRTRYLWVLLVGVVLANLPLLHALLARDDAGRASRISGPLVVTTLAADATLALGALLVRRFGLGRRPQLRAVAMEDVRRCDPGTSLDRVGGETFLVRGEVLEVADDRLVLDLGGRSIVVLLDDHDSTVRPRESAQVQARLI